MAKHRFASSLPARFAILLFVAVAFSSINFVRVADAAVLRVDSDGNTVYSGNANDGRTCADTDGDVAAKCTDNGTFCHSWVDSGVNDPNYRATWVNDLVFLHRVHNSSYLPTSDISFTKTMHFTGPGLASLPSCEASWETFVSRADAIVNGATKHVRFHLKGSCEYDESASSCVRTIAPDTVTSPTSLPAAGGSEGAMQGISFGVDLHGVRDLINVNYDAGGQGQSGEVRGQLMYNIFTRAEELTGLDWNGDPTDSRDTLEISPSKNVTSGNFKFTYGMHFLNGYAFDTNADVLRIEFTLETVAFDEGDITWHDVETSGQLTRVNYFVKDKITRSGDTETLINATTTAGTAGQTLYDVNSTFGLDFSPKFQYGDYNAATHTYDYVEADAEVTLSADNATVYVHLPLSAALKTKLANTPTSSTHVGSLPEKTFLILYDPELATSESRPVFPSDDSDKKRILLIAGVCAGAAGLILITITLVWCRRRKQRRQGGAKSAILG
jgi:hypothetical protein